MKNRLFKDISKISVFWYNRQKAGCFSNIVYNIGNQVETLRIVYVEIYYGYLKFNYNTDADVSDARIVSPGGYVVAGAGNNVYLINLNGGLKGKFDVEGTVDMVNTWGKYISAGVIGENSQHYLFDENGVVDIRHGDESEMEEVDVKSVMNKGDYAVVKHTATYENNATNDKFKFYELGFTRAFDINFFSFLNDLRGKANAKAHSLDVYTDPKIFEPWKAKINEYSKLLSSVIQRVKDTPS